MMITQLLSEQSFLALVVMAGAFLAMWIQNLSRPYRITIVHTDGTVTTGTQAPEQIAPPAQSPLSQLNYQDFPTFSLTPGSPLDGSNTTPSVKDYQARLQRQREIRRQLQDYQAREADRRAQQDVDLTPPLSLSRDPEAENKLFDDMLSRRRRRREQSPQPSTSSNF